MCFPKAPKEDPQVKIQQEEARTAELARLAEEKQKQLVSTKRTLRGSASAGSHGCVSLLTGRPYGRTALG